MTVRVITAISIMQNMELQMALKGCGVEAHEHEQKSQECVEALKRPR